MSERRGQPSNHKPDAVFEGRTPERPRTRYPDFGPTLAAEYLQQGGFPLSRATLRQWMVEGGLWRAAKPHPPRPRRPRLGELVQIDGSPRDRFEGRGPRCTPVAFIGDAASRVMAARLTRRNPASLSGWAARLCSGLHLSGGTL
ncbi:MAG: hypothetical protein EPO42_12395 [Gallionellaceae bacterium]|nr:MAG: hypothetical protein EPO42_12395 [Gallionellaceae bacterium]